MEGFEGAATVLAGVLAGSIALVANGLDFRDRGGGRAWWLDPFVALGIAGAGARGRAPVLAKRRLRVRDVHRSSRPNVGITAAKP
jgi:hypothetical protein